MSPTPSGTGPLDPGVSGIDPALMDGFVAAMSRAHALIGEHSRALRDELERARVSASALTPVKAVEDWTGEQLPRLRTRLEVIRRKVPGWGPLVTARGLITYDEGQVPYASPGESREEGAALAALYRDNLARSAGKVDTKGLREERAALLSRLLARKGDADFAAAFFAGLGARATVRLPEDVRLLYDDSPTVPVDERHTGKEAALAGLSAAFATATAARRRVPAFGKVMDDLARRGDETHRDGLSWLVSTGHFPTDWLASVARANVVLPMLSRTLRQTEISLGTTSRFLRALAGNPAAARAAVGGTGGDWTSQPPSTLPVPSGMPRPTVGGVLSAMNAYVAGDRRTSDAFGSMLAAASGVYDEKDGAHSQDAARFAFHVITTAPKLSMHDVMKRHLAEIGGSYATEFAAGAESMDPGAFGQSRFGTFDDELPGTKPAFRLSLRDGYRYLQLFADTDENMEPFDRGMAGLAQRLFTLSLDIDKHRIAHPPADGSQPVTAVEHLFSRLGAVSGMQFAAMKVVRGTADAEARRGYETFELALDKGADIALLSTPTFGLPAAAAAAGWTVFSWAVKDGLGAVLEPDARLPDVNDKELTKTMAALHDMAAALMDGGYTGAKPPVRFRAPTDPLIVGDDGRLRPYAEIAKDPKAMTAFLEWLKSNGSTDDRADRRSFGRLAASAASKFSAQQDVAQALLAASDKRLKSMLTGRDQ